MIIDGRLPEGYVIICDSHRESHSFLVKHLGPSVECPRCGCTAISTLLVTEFSAKQAHGRSSSHGEFRPAMID